MRARLTIGGGPENSWEGGRTCCENGAHSILLLVGLKLLNCTLSNGIELTISWREKMLVSNCFEGKCGEAAAWLWSNNVRLAITIK